MIDSSVFKKAALESTAKQERYFSEHGKPDYARVSGTKLFARLKLDSEVRHCQKVSPTRSVLKPSPKPLKGPPVHPFGFEYRVMDDARSAKFLVDALRPSKRSKMRSLMLALVDKLIAMPARKDSATIEHRDSLPTSPGRTEKPGTLPTKIAAGVGKSYRVFFALPVLPSAAVFVSEDYGIVSGPALPDT